jgi:DNA polymerase-3 subunit epsilon
MSKTFGVRNKRIDQSPIAVIDFETTGLTPGFDRVIEVSVVRRDPGEQPRLAFDTLVNPMRPVAATEIHGITDDDVADAPCFKDIAGDFVAAVTDCVVAAYNVYFDIKFLAFELSQVAVDHIPPHLCLMYLRPMLGIGSRCRLEEACRAHDIDLTAAHIAAEDAQASAKLLECYLVELHNRDISTFSDLAALKKYKFVESFNNDPLPDPAQFNLSRCNTFCSRTQRVSEAPIDAARQALMAYWDVLRSIVADLEITDEELEYATQERRRLGLKEEQVRALHARAFTGAITQFLDDQLLDDQEVEKLRRLHNCLSQLGWAPGE